MSTRLRTSVPLSLACAATLLACAGYSERADAQTGPAAPEASLGEVVVRGEKIDRTLQETQSSVAVITADVLDSAGISDVYEVFDRVANVSQAENNEAFVIRGIQSRGVTRDSVATASVYLDGAVQPIVGNFADSISPYNVWDTQQVEVFRGPQSTNQGRGSLAGAIVVVTKDPTFDWEGRVRAQYAEHDSFELGGAVSGPIVADRVAFRLAVQKRKSDGYLENSFFGIDDADGLDELTARGKLLFNVSDTFDALLTISHTDVETGEPETDAANPFDYVSTSSVSDVRSLENRQYVLRLNWDLGTTTLTSVSALGDVQQDRRPRPGTVSGFFDLPAGLDAVQEVDAEADVFTQELRATFKPNDRLSGVIGAYYADIETSARRRVTFTPRTFAQLQTSVVRNKALFGEVEYRLSDAWRLIGGLRYDDEDADRGIFFLNSNTFINEGGDQSAASYDAFLPKVGIVRDFTPNVSLGFTAQRAYRAGGSGTSAFSGLDYQYDPEYTNNYELAFRSVLGGRAVLNANAFMIDWSDQQVSFPLAGNALDEIVQNVGESRIYGFELETTVRVSSAFQFYGSLGYAHTEFKKFPTPDPTLSYDGNRFPYAPEWQASVGGTYSGANGFFASADVSYNGSYYTELANSPLDQVDSYTIVNAKVGWQGASWSAYVFAKNLFDEEYLTRNASWDEFFGPYAYVGQPRVAGVEVNFSF